MAAPYLHVTPIAPRRHGNGLAMRASMFSEALASLGETEILVVDDEKRALLADDLAGSVLRHLDTKGRHDTRLRLIHAVTDAAARAEALRALGRPFATSRLSAPVMSDFARIAGEGRRRGIVVSRAYLLPLIEALGDAPPCPVIVDLDDDDGGLARQRARLEDDAARAPWLQAEADACDALIARNAGAVSLFTAASEEAAAALGRRLPIGDVAAIVNGIEIAFPGHRSPPTSGGLLFVGNLAYPPNVDGLEWFIRDVWSRILETRPGTRLVVAGSNPGRDLSKLLEAPRTSLIANPDDLEPLYREAAGAIVPLRAGSGSRIKILEAGAHSVPVVATQAGAAGLALDPTRDFFASNIEPTEFAKACLRCLDDRDEAARRGANLRRFVETHHDRRRVIADIASILGSFFRP